MNFDFPIEIIRTERSKSASIEIEDDTVKVTVPQNLSDLRIEELIKKHSPKQYIVTKFLYTFRTQNIGVDLTNPMLSFVRTNGSEQPHLTGPC